MARKKATSKKPAARKKAVKPKKPSVAEQVQTCAGSVGGRVWVASASMGGEPHLALSTRLAMPDDHTVRLTEFCCLKTVDNLRENDRVAVGVWSTSGDEGWQLVGTVKAIELDADAADAIQYTLTIGLYAAMHLTPGRHSDAGV